MEQKSWAWRILWMAVIALCAGIVAQAVYGQGLGVFFIVLWAGAIILAPRGP